MNTTPQLSCLAVRAIWHPQTAAAEQHGHVFVTTSIINNIMMMSTVQHEHHAAAQLSGHQGHPPPAAAAAQFKPVQCQEHH
jgi:hypothetical protein